MHIEYLTRHTL